MQSYVKIIIKILFIIVTESAHLQPTQFGRVNTLPTAQSNSASARTSSASSLPPASPPPPASSPAPPPPASSSAPPPASSPHPPPASSPAPPPPASSPASPPPASTPPPPPASSSAPPPPPPPASSSAPPPPPPPASSHTSIQCSSPSQTLAIASSSDSACSSESDDESATDNGSTTCPISSASSSTSSNSVIAECDIGKMLVFNVNIDSLSRTEKYKILTTEPDPNPKSYPRTRLYASGAFRQFNPSWLNKYPWLHYSREVDGVFCRACAFFAPGTAGGQALGQFVTQPFRSWVNKTQKMNGHSKLDYHLTAKAKMTEFLARHENPSQTISTIFEQDAKRRMAENKKVVESLFKIVLLCGKQGIPFRGHRDDNVNWTETEEQGNQGNFIELVRFRAQTDDILCRHLQNAQKNAVYTSKTIQNELIEAAGKHIRDKLFMKVKQATFFSIIADEVVDVANKEQLSLCL